MLKEIKNKIEKELTYYIRDLNKTYPLSKNSPLLFTTIADFVLRPGKRVRPLLFVIGYLGFAKGIPGNLYKTALAMELVHDFMLVHDDIIDKSATRRGKPSMHRMLGNNLQRFKNIKFNGQDLAIIAGDVVYALAIDTFLSIKVDIQRKVKALRKFIAATIYTEMGEFIELLSGIKEIGKLTKEEIYKIYDYKTAYYSFSSPLACGAIFAGAGQSQIDKIYKYGIYLGRAFQIQDDILGMFGEEKKIGKSSLTDLQEAKKTLLIWYAYNHANKSNKLMIKRILSKDNVKKCDLLKMRKIIKVSGALDYAQGEILNLLKKAQDIIKSSRMRRKYKTLLATYCRELLRL